MFESRIEKIDSIKWDGENHVEINSDGGVFCGAKRKDFWNPDNNWEDIIVPGVNIRLWTVQYSRVIGFEVLKKSKKLLAEWEPVWCCTNNFQTKSERERADKAYVDFIQQESEIISGLIDAGMSLKEIDSMISRDHSGNTYACALGLGIKNAKNKIKAEEVRKEHNAKYGKKDGEGLVNPAIMTIKT